MQPIGQRKEASFTTDGLQNADSTRRSDGYLLPFTIPHSRLAELIGATHSTVTRQINGPRQQGELQLWEDGVVLFSDRLIEQKPLPRLLSNPECVRQMARYRHLHR
jgi:hypothetical protein